MSAIKNSGINFLNLANNHIFDHGEQGLKSTIEALKNQDLNFVGAGKSLVEASNHSQLKLRVKPFQY